jgi:hypothetical protein
VRGAGEPRVSGGRGTELRPFIADKDVRMPWYRCGGSYSFPQESSGPNISGEYPYRCVGRRGYQLSTRKRWKGQIERFGEFDPLREIGTA